MKYGSLYRKDNVILSGTHTHSGPAGYFQYTLFVIASEGYTNRTFEYIVSGIVQVGKEPQKGAVLHWCSQGFRSGLVLYGESLYWILI